MISMIGENLDPSETDRVFKLTNFNSFVVSVPLPYDDGLVQLDEFEYKQVLLRLHNLHDDHLFSVREYQIQIEWEYSDKIVRSLIASKCLILIKTNTKEYVSVTDLGKKVDFGIEDIGLTKMEMKLLRYVIEESIVRDFQASENPEIISPDE